LSFMNVRELEGLNMKEVSSLRLSNLVL